MKSRLFEYGSLIAARHDVLPAEEQVRLALAYQAGDEKAGEKLIASNVRLVMQVAVDLYGDRDELFSEGMFGLMEAARRYDPTKGSKFSSYAWLWIRAKCLSFISQRSHMVRLSSRGARELLWKAARERGKMIAEGFDPTAERLAERMEMSLKDVEELYAVLTPPLSLSPGPDRDEPRLLADDRVPTPEEACIVHDDHMKRCELLGSFSASGTASFFKTGYSVTQP